MTLYQVNYSNLETKKQPLRGLKQGGQPSKPVLVPCGKCIGCRLERSRQWAIRCVHESQMHDRNAFVTLTYNDEHITHGGMGYTLYPRHLQLFFKKLRKEYGPKIKFFACGEYGEKYGRPHYHACIFGIDFKHDQVEILPRRGEFPVYTSPSLQALWMEGKGKNKTVLGDVAIGEVNFETAAYCARYIMKKKLGKQASIYKKVGIEPEFTRMSRRPGIGSSWYDKWKTDVFPHDYVVLREGIKCRPPKFYGSKYELENPDKWASIKDIRKQRAELHAKDNVKTRLATKERNSKYKIDQLKRGLNV